MTYTHNGATYTDAIWNLEQRDLGRYSGQLTYLSFANQQCCKDRKSLPVSRRYSLSKEDIDANFSDGITVAAADTYVKAKLDVNTGEKEDGKPIMKSFFDGASDI